MRTKAVIKFLGVLICVAVSVSPVWCHAQGKQRVRSFGHSISPDDNPQINQRIEEIDKEIAKRKASIKQNQELERLWTYQRLEYTKNIAAQAGGPRGTIGVGSNHDGPVGAGHNLQDTGLQWYEENIASVKPANEREEQRISALEYEKRQLLSQQKNACFPGETLVLTGEGILKPIEQINPGDRVMTFDIGAQADIPKPVLNTYKNGNNHYYLINNAVKVTALERFLTPDGWKKVLNLKLGDKIQTSQGLEPIRSMVVLYGPLEVHNLHVEGSHTFYVVGKDKQLYLVHNTSGGGGGSK